MVPEVQIVFHRIARADLFGIYSYIEEHGGSVRAGRYVDRVEAACRQLTTFPEKGAPRDDIAPGLRTWAMERRVLIVYRIAGSSLEILRILYAGRDFQTDDVPN